MSTFLWASGHLGWGIFALVAFSALWVLLVDAWWRLRDTRIGRFVALTLGGWVVGAALVVLVFYLCNR